MRVWFSVLRHGGAVVIAAAHTHVIFTNLIANEHDQGAKNHTGDQTLPKSAMTAAALTRAALVMALAPASAF